MKLINKKYIMLNRFDIFGQLIKANEKNDKQESLYFNKLIRSLLDYEKEKKQFIKSIYIDKDSIYAKKYIKIDDVPIDRQTIINALLLSMINDEIDIALKLKTFIHEDRLLPNELGDLLDYILEHSIDINEYLNGEELKIIYNEKSNDFEKGYIYNDSQLVKEKKLIK